MCEQEDIMENTEQTQNYSETWDQLGKLRDIAADIIRHQPYTAYNNLTEALQHIGIAIKELSEYKDKAKENYYTTI